MQRSIYRTIREAASPESRMRDLAGICDTLCGSEYIASAAAQQLELGCGTARIRVEVPESVFYGIVEQETGVHITDAADLISVLRDFAGIRQRYERLHGALDQVQQTGYGIVMPSTEELTLEEPEIVRQGGRSLPEELSGERDFPIPLLIDAKQPNLSVQKSVAVWMNRRGSRNIQMRWNSNSGTA